MTERIVVSNPDWRRAVVSGGLAAVLAIGLLAGAAPASATTDGSGVVVDVNEEGDADVSLTLGYDLSDADERDAFEELRDDTEMREELQDRFAERMASIADETSERTGREMTITGAAVDVDADGDHGIVRISVHWEAIAAVEDGTVTVEEPFASGFVSEYRFEIVGPDGYVIENAAPEPDERDGERATWDAGTSFDGLSVTFLEGESTPEADPDDQPGLGIAVALGAILAAAMVSLRR